MKRLTKILLINWHMFSFSELEIKNNVLITGHNGAGKSTLLDAVQYVLTGGSKKFNLAANEDGARKLEGYVRGRLGMESQENLRDGDVTTHVALEFLDEEEGRPFVLGAVIDLPENGKCRESFYIAYRTGAVRSLYIKESGEIYTRSQFERNLKRNGIKYNVPPTMSEARRMVTNTFSVNTKYSDLIKRALAFKPINDLNEFMYRFLLPEERINIDSLRENVLQYRKFEATLNEQQERLKLLEELNSRKMELEDVQNELRINAYLAGKIRIASDTARRETLQGLIKDMDRKKTRHETEEALLQQKMTEILKQIASIQAQMNTLDAEGRIASLKERKQMLESRYEEGNTWIKNTAEALRKDISVLDKLSITHHLSADPEALLEDDKIAESLIQADQQVKILHDTLLLRNRTIETEKEEKQKLLAETTKRVQTLKAKNYPYNANVQALITLLREELSRSAGREIHVKPFCEYLEINDEKWRNAVEGYLNTQRFDLFVEPQYFKRAVRIYEQFKEARGIYGIGIVDVGKLEQFDEIKAGTLAEQVRTENPYARQYANMLLGRVDCEEHAEDLNTHTSAITPSCMIYRNYTVRAINPQIYAKPFIGLHAIELQLKKEIETEDQLRKELQNLQRREREVTHQRELLKQVSFSYAHSFAAQRQNYVSVKDEFETVSSQLETLLNDPSWITLEEQMREMNDRQLECNKAIQSEKDALARCKAEAERAEQEFFDLESHLKEARTAQEILQDSMLELLERAEREYETLKRNARNEFSRMQTQNERRKEMYNESLRDLANTLKDGMHAYNLRTGYGFEESIEAMDQYTAQYDKLRTIDIEDSINRTIEARRKCERTFQEEFISTLRAKIERAKTSLRQLNRALEDKSFQGDHYSFIYDASEDRTFAEYYRILCSNQDYPTNDIFMEQLSEQNRRLMDELFARLVSGNEKENNEKILRDYTDYRKYMKYDIRITHENGDSTLFSKVTREKSGGETQTPFYVIIAASFDQLAISRKGTGNGCLVLFDEAFSNMDEPRIEAMMHFYRSLNIQLMIAVPEGRISNIMPYMDTTLLLVKKNNRILSKGMIHES